MSNVPVVKMGMIAVSRDCFPIALSERRSKAVEAAVQAKGMEFYRAEKMVENEKDMLAAVEEIKKAGVNA